MSSTKLLKLEQARVGPATTTPVKLLILMPSYGPTGVSGDAYLMSEVNTAITIKGNPIINFLYQKISLIK